MKLPPLVDGRMVRRYKRFLADVELADGSIVTAHCPNTGAMTGCWEPGAPVQLSTSDNPRRKLRFTLERVDMGQGWIGVNTARVNGVVAAMVSAGDIEPLTGYSDIRREPAFAAEGFPKSRFDLLLTEPGRRDCYVEIKNTTLFADHCIQFPDARTERGRKHLDLLEKAVARGCRAVIVFAANRPEGECFRAAVEIDPDYAVTLDRALAGGVEIIVARLRHTTSGIRFGGLVPPCNA